MINTKRCRSEFLSLLNNLYNINDKNYCNQIAQQIKSLKQYIKEEYSYDKELPKISHRFIDKINQDLEDIEILNNNLLLSKGYDLPEEIKTDKQKILKKVSELIPEYQVNNKIDKAPISSSNLPSMLKIYCETFGETNTIKALQCGLDIFCKERKHIFEPQKISINGKIDDKLLNLINEIKSKYSTDVIEKYLVKGLMSNTVLEGGIGNYKYIWHSNDCACEKCQSLEGTEYDNEKDIPDKPHPNCKCYIEVVEQNRCDCLDDLLTELCEIIGDAMALQSEILSGIYFFTNVLITKKCSRPALAIIESCIDALQQILGTINDFIQNYNDMKEANTIGGDKYFHSKANCQGAQRGELGAIVARGICALREFTDQFSNVFKKGMTLYESLIDSYEDFEANQYGREQGRNNPDVESRILIDKYRPNGLPDRY